MRKYSTSSEDDLSLQLNCRVRPIGFEPPANNIENQDLFNNQQNVEAPLPSETEEINPNSSIENQSATEFLPKENFETNLDYIEPSNDDQFEDLKALDENVVKNENFIDDPFASPTKTW